MKEKRTTYKEAQVCYKTAGNGFPVVLIHGFAEDSRIWYNQVEFLQKNYQLIIPDLPGSGKSGLLKQDNAGISDYAACIKEILDQEKIKHCIMIGHSMGGYITLAYAEKYPSTLRAFGLFHSGAYADDEAKVDMRRKAIDFIRKNGPDAFLKTSIPGLFYEGGNAVHADALIEQGRAFSADALIQYYQAMIARPDRTEILKNSTMPVLFILGEHDKAIPFQHGLEQSHLPGESYIYVLRNSAHMGMLEEPEKSNEILANFLLKQAAGN